VVERQLELSDPEGRMPALELAWRVAWIAARLIIVIHLGQQGVLFFYQKF
jgi:hypothetical protein